MKRQQQGVGWGAGHACDSPPSDASLSSKRLYVSFCASVLLVCGEVLTHGGLPVFISILDSRFSAGCGLQLAALVRCDCRMPLVRHPTVRRLRTSHSNRLPVRRPPSHRFRSQNSLARIQPNERRSPTNTRRSKRKAQESKPSKPEQPPFPSTRRSSTAVQKPHSNPRIPNDKIVDTTN